MLCINGKTTKTNFSLFPLCLFALCMIFACIAYVFIAIVKTFFRFVFAFTQTKTLGYKKFSAFPWNVTFYYKLLVMFSLYEDERLRAESDDEEEANANMWWSIHGIFIVLSMTGNLLEYFSSVIKCWINLWVTHNSHIRVQRSRKNFLRACLMLSNRTNLIEIFIMCKHRMGNKKNVSCQTMCTYVLFLFKFLLLSFISHRQRRWRRPTAQLLALISVSTSFSCVPTTSRVIANYFSGL